MKKKFEDLEIRIQNLINSHQKLKSENEDLRKANHKLERMVEDERVRQKRVEEGFMELRDVQKAKSKQRISGIKGKVNEMISEIDRSVALIDVQS